MSQICRRTMQPIESESGHRIAPTSADGVMQKPRVIQLFEAAKAERRPLQVCAPMVRYSKLPFRMLLRECDVDVTYTPMILAHEFIRSQVARDSDFTTCPAEREPTSDGRQHALIAQFAASNPEDFARAAELIAPWVDGVDLNCGCPQSWAIKEGIGCSLMEDPELVASLVRAAKASLGPGKSVSCKIRIHKDLSQTVRWVRVLEEAGVDFITVHGRTRSQRSSTPPDFAAIKSLKQSVCVPVLANGDIYAAEDVKRIVSMTGVDGVMAARGMLENPALFVGHDTTPVDCARRFLEHAVRYPIPFQLVLHHFAEMTVRMPSVTKKERQQLMDCRDLIDLIDFVEDKWRL
ncbi:tRNA dihydrouridine synthase [Saxophila tyrrhenica]|uniref:tRNA-dihydrouridine(20a/20b) synthase [NAD(P)+] n=1 Tax=Saxophila tyrrhenica TaxID=1690608 RepID=A0AAV9P8R8_9PEZI|nr:tRNA dihydrouridine synthase [Saxophila tyrrhenica]